MGDLSFRCPKTTLPINTGFATDHKSLARAWNEIMHVRCPHCGKIHDVKVRDAFIVEAISETTLHGAAAVHSEIETEHLAERMTGVRPWKRRT